MRNRNMLNANANMKSNPSTTIVPRLGRPIGWLCASLLAATGPFVATSLAQTQNVLEIDEVGESATPVVTYNGSTVTLDPASTLFKDNWTIELPSTFSLNQVTAPELLGEPENATQINQISVGTSPRFIVWASDQNAPAGTAGPFQNPITILNAGTFTPTPGGPSQTFELVLKDLPGTQVPDASSTAMLLGLALLGLFGVVRTRAARA
jgi:hypothetical protein